MSVPLVLRPEAQDDLTAARDWYERQRPGLGGEFLDAVEEFFARIAVSPELYGLVHRDVRRGKARRFPYIVYYRTLGDHIEILAVLHGSRDPQLWRNRKR